MKVFIAATVLAMLAWSSDADAQERVARALVWSYAFAAAVDTVQTPYALGKSEGLREAGRDAPYSEANPLLAALVERHGVVPAVVVKATLHIGIVGVLMNLSHDHSKTAIGTAIVLTAMQGYVDISNYRTFRKMGGAR